MKSFLLCCSLLIMNALIAQDTIVFADGKVKNVTILSVDSLGQINYEQHDKIKTIHQSEIIEYSDDGQWYSYQKETDNFIKIEGSNYRLYNRFFDSSPSYSYSRFSIATSLTDPFIYANMGEWTNINVLYTNPSITIEPAYLISDYWSVKIPLYIGFNLRTPLSYDVAVNNIYENNTIYQGNVRLNSNMHYYALSNAVGDGIEPNITARGQKNNWSSSTNSITHERNFLYQLGISPRFYPFRQKKQSLFIQQSFIVGIADYFQVDYYSNFDTTHLFISESELIQWNLYAEKALQSKSQFLFFRYEATVGVELNWTRNINFSAELGFTTQPTNQGDPDRFYFQYKPGEDYQLVQTKMYQFENQIYPIGRLHLIYKFHGIKL